MSGELIECPACKKTIEVPRRSVAPPVKIAPAPAPSASPRSFPTSPPQASRKAKIVAKTEFAGAGALVQLIGIIACFTVVGIIVGIPLLIVGSNMSKKFTCGECGNRLADKNVRMCPVCKVQLTK
jgi:hypothetical protein